MTTLEIVSNSDVTWMRMSGSSYTDNIQLRGALASAHMLVQPLDQSDAMFRHFCSVGSWPGANKSSQVDWKS